MRALHTWLKGLLDYATDTDAYRRIRARAEKAEARVVKFRALCKAQHGAVARAERAEAELAREWRVPISEVPRA